MIRYNTDFSPCGTKLHGGGRKKTDRLDLSVCFFIYIYLPMIYASIDSAACLPAPIALMTVAAPVTASPPA